MIHSLVPFFFVVAAEFFIFVAEIKKNHWELLFLFLFLLESWYLLFLGSDLLFLENHFLRFSEEGFEHVLVVLEVEVFACFFGRPGHFWDFKVWLVDHRVIHWMNIVAVGISTVIFMRTNVIEEAVIFSLALCSIPAQMNVPALVVPLFCTVLLEANMHFLAELVGNLAELGGNVPTKMEFWGFGLLELGLLNWLGKEIQLALEHFVKWLEYLLLLRSLLILVLLDSLKHPVLLIFMVAFIRLLVEGLHFEPFSVHLIVKAIHENFLRSINNFRVYFQKFKIKKSRWSLCFLQTNFWI